MHNELIKNNLDFILESIRIIQERFKAIIKPDDFVLSPFGVNMLDSIAMRLQIFGENVKQIEKIEPSYLNHYEDIQWIDIVKLRDLISHHYGEIDYEAVFLICKNDIEILKNSIERMLKEFNNK